MYVLLVVLFDFQFNLEEDYFHRALSEETEQMWAWFHIHFR